MICQYLNIKNLCIFGRDYRKAKKLCDHLCQLGLNAEPVDSIKALCAQSTIVVITTPSTVPLITLDDLPNLDVRALFIIAVGADSPGKIEIAPEVMAKAVRIYTDDHNQCMSQSDFGMAVRAGLVNENSDQSFCKVVGETKPKIPPTGLSIVDLTGRGI